MYNKAQKYATAAALQEHGPWIEVNVYPVSRSPGSRRSCNCTALIDTGASITCISEKTLYGLGVLSHHTGELQTPAGERQAQIYFVDLELVFDGERKKVYEALQVYGSEDMEPHQMLLGRDILRDGWLMYYGSEGRFTFQLP